MADNDLSPVCCTRARDFSSRDADIGRSRVDSRFDSIRFESCSRDTCGMGSWRTWKTWMEQPTDSSVGSDFVSWDALRFKVIHSEWQERMDFSTCRTIYYSTVASTTIHYWHCCKQVGLKVQSKAWNDVWCQHTQPVHSEGIRVLVEFTCSSCWGGWHDFLLYLLQAVVCYEIAIE